MRSIGPVAIHNLLTGYEPNQLDNQLDNFDNSEAWTTPRQLTTTPSQNEEYCTLARYTPPTGHKPKLLDNFHYSETSASIFQDESVDIDTEPSCSCDAELDDELVGKALSSPLFIQEREEPANLRQTCHSHEESLLPAQSFFTRTSTGDPHTNQVQICLKNGNQVATQKTSESGFSLKDKKEQILAEVRSEIQKHELQAESG